MSFAPILLIVLGTPCAASPLQPVEHDRTAPNAAPTTQDAPEVPAVAAPVASAELRLRRHLARLTNSGRLRGAIALLMLVFMACDTGSRASEVTSGAAKPPPTRAESAMETDEPALKKVVIPPPQPEFGDLREERPFDASTLKGGLRRLSSCEDYQTYVTDAFVDFHLRRLFSEDYGRPFRVAEGLPRVGPPERAWAVDGTRAFLEYKEGFYVAAAVAKKAHVVENPMYAIPALQSAALGFLFVGRSAFLSGPEDRGFLQFQAGGSASGWGDYHGVRKTHYQQFQSSSISLYGRSDSTVKFLYSMGMAGALIGIHVDAKSKTAYIVTLTEPHIAAATAAAGRAISAPTRHEAEKKLRTIPIRVPKQELPFYSWQVNPMNTAKRNFSGRFGCDDYFVANDTATVGQRILLVHSFDLDRLRYGRPMAVTVEAGFRVAISGDRLLLARRLHGAAWIDGTIDRPMTELDVFDLGDKPELVETHRLQGVPVDVIASSSGAMVVTTRGEDVERLTYSIVGTTLDEEPQRQQPTVAPAVMGDVPSFVWRTGLPIEHDLVFMLGEKVVAVSHVDHELSFSVFAANGTRESTMRVEDVIRWESDDLIATEEGFIVSVRGVSRDDALLGRVDGDQLTLQPVSAPRGTAYRVVTDDTLLAMGSRRVVWVEPRSGEELESIEWDAVKPTAAGRPTGP